MANVHFSNEKRRVERDLRIPDIADDLGSEVCNFVEVTKEKSGTAHVLTYHPNPEAILPPGAEWIAKPAVAIGNGGKFYKKASNETVRWCYKVIKGQIFDIIDKEFNDDVLAGNYNNAERQKFCRKVAGFIVNHPHDSAKKYGVYLRFFMEMIKVMDEKLDDIFLDDLLVQIANEMKRVVEYNSRDLPQRDIYNLVMNTTTSMTIQQCSKNVHYKLSRIDKDAESAKNELLALANRAQQKRLDEALVKQKRMEEMKAKMMNRNKALPEVGQKRKIEEITGAEDLEKQAPAKEQKTDDNAV